MNTNITEVQETGKSDKGFTLVELLIVIVILGILATVTVFAVRGITDQGQTSACEASQKSYQVAIEAWYAQNGSTTHPDGAALVTEGLIRSYDGTDVSVLQGTPDNPATPAVNENAISTVGATVGGDCEGLITAG